MLTFYDSGIGGLTVVNQYLKLSTNAKFQYYGDFDILPLGDKSRTEILSQVKFVATKIFVDCDLLILACNTASVNTIRELQQEWLPKHYPNKQILSISKPITELLESRYSNFKNKKLIILATQATIDSGFYQKEFEQIGFKNVKATACPGLCELVESEVQKHLPFQKYSQFLSQAAITNFFYKMENLKIETKAINQYLINLKLSKNSLILLACTHYPIVKNMIKIAYPDCIIIDPSEFIATKLIDYKYRHGFK